MLLKKLFVKINSIKTLPTVVVLILLLVSVFIILIANKHYTPQNNYGESIIDFNDKWVYINIKGEKQEVQLPVSLDVQKSEICTIVKTLPNDIKEHDALLFRSSLQTVEIKVSQTIIYNNDLNVFRPFGMATPSKWNFAYLPENSAGKEVSITYYSPYKKNSGKISDIKIGDKSELLEAIFKSKLPSYMVSILIAVVGVFIFLYALVFGKKNREYNAFKYLGLFVFFVGIWMKTESKMPPLFITNDYVELLLAFFSLMLAPMAFILFVKYKDSNHFSKPFNILFCLFAINFISLTFLQVFNIYDFIETVFITHILILIGIAICIFTYAYSVINKKIRNLKSEFIGTISFVIGTIAEIIAFYNSNYNVTGLLFEIGFIIYLSTRVISSVISIVQETKNSVTYLQQLQEQKAYMMVSQMQPHFIFNSLGAIKTMIKTSPDVAYKTITHFSNYLRANINSLNSNELIPFSRELDHIQAYTEIEKIRFGNKLNVVFDIQTSGFFVPPLTIQPLVENAIKHGICKKVEGGTVILSTYENNSNYIITVSDDGVGFDQNSLNNVDDNVSIGLKNIQSRLKKKMGSEISFDSKIGKGTTAIVSIPKYCEGEIK